MEANSASPSKEESDEKAKEMVSTWEDFNPEIIYEDVIIFDN